MGEKRTHPGLVLRKLVACLFDGGGFLGQVGCWMRRLIDHERAGRLMSRSREIARTVRGG